MQCSQLEIIVLPAACEKDRILSAYWSSSGNSHEWIVHRIGGEASLIELGPIVNELD